MNAVKDRPPRLPRQHVRDREWGSEHIQELLALRLIGTSRWVFGEARTCACFAIRTSLD